MSHGSHVKKFISIIGAKPINLETHENQTSYSKQDSVYDEKVYEEKPLIFLTGVKTENKIEESECSLDDDLIDNS